MLDKPASHIFQSSSSPHLVHFDEQIITHNHTLDKHLPFWHIWVTFNITHTNTHKHKIMKSNIFNRKHKLTCFCLTKSAWKNITNGITSMLPMFSNFILIKNIITHVHNSNHTKKNNVSRWKAIVNLSYHSLAVNVLLINPPIFIISKLQPHTKLSSKRHYKHSVTTRTHTHMKQTN